MSPAVAIAEHVPRLGAATDFSADRDSASGDTTEERGQGKGKSYGKTEGSDGRTDGETEATEGTPGTQNRGQ